jgi:hypothetical protein
MSAKGVGRRDKGEDGERPLGMSERFVLFQPPSPYGCFWSLWYTLGERNTLYREDMSRRVRAPHLKPRVLFVQPHILSIVRDEPFWDREGPGGRCLLCRCPKMHAGGEGHGDHGLNIAEVACGSCGMRRMISFQTMP